MKNKGDMIQLTDKLFAVPVPENTIDVEFNKRGVYFKSSIEQDNTLKRLTMFGFDATLLGTVSKDTIDFDVEPYVEKDEVAYEQQLYIIYGKHYCTKNGQHTRVLSTSDANESFRSLLTSKGCNPDEKHLIIEKI
jgi:hypothetical protein